MSEQDDRRAKWVQGLREAIDDLELREYFLNRDYRRGWTDAEVAAGLAYPLEYPFEPSEGPRSAPQAESVPEVHPDDERA